MVLTRQFWRGSSHIPAPIYIPHKNSRFSRNSQSQNSCENLHSTILLHNDVEIVTVPLISFQPIGTAELKVKGSTALWRLTGPLHGNKLQSPACYCTFQAHNTALLLLSQNIADLHASKTRIFHICARRGIQKNLHRDSTTYGNTTFIALHKASCNISAR